MSVLQSLFDRIRSIFGFEPDEDEITKSLNTMVERLRARAALHNKRSLDALSEASRLKDEAVKASMSSLSALRRADKIKAAF